MTRATTQAYGYPFYRLFNQSYGTPNRSRQTAYTGSRQAGPAVNIQENATRFVVEVAAPGRKKEDFNVQLDHDVLTISAGQPAANAEAQYTRREFSAGAFERSFSLPETVAADKIVATYENGILTLALPKKEEAKPQARTIAVA